MARTRTSPPAASRSSLGAAGSLSAWARVTLPLAALRDAALLSRRMWEQVLPLLPAALACGVQPGRWQDEVWSLTASSSAVAAKLSQLKPLLLRRLQLEGFAVRDIRIRVQPQESRSQAPIVAGPAESACPPAVLARFQALRKRLG